jgi:hypothetical protein
VIPGTTRRAYHYDRFAAALAGDFTVHVIDRPAYLQGVDRRSRRCCRRQKP